MPSPSFPEQIFRAYDIRGLADGPQAELTPQLTYEIARAYGAQLEDVERVVIGGDQRLSTPLLKESAIFGLRDAGLDVIDIGLAPSPLVYWAAAQQHRERSTAGLVITASHNPADQNGIKLLDAGGTPLLPEAIQQIAEAVKRGGLPSSTKDTARTSWDPKPLYLGQVAYAIRSDKSLNIAVDPGNGAACVTALEALAAVSASLHAINSDPYELNPAHPADPQHAENVEQLCRFVKQTDADLGFAFDGDGDRLGLVDSRGKRASPDAVLAVLAQDWLQSHPGATVHVDVKTSNAVIEHIERHGGRVVIGRVGHSLAKHDMAAQEIGFGGEASTHYYYRVDSPPHISDDAVRTACQIVRIAEQQPIEDLLDAVPAYPNSQEVKIDCPDRRKHKIVAAIARAAGKRWPVNDVDGARIDLSSEADGAWCLIRASNTGPNLTVVVEARDLDGYETARQITAELLIRAGRDAEALLRTPPQT